MNSLEAWETDPRIAQTVYAVEANSFESLSLWERWKDYEGLKWKEQSSGLFINLGNFNKMPVCFCISWTEIGGHLVAFYHSISQVVDYRMIEKWIKDRGWKNSDAMNFGHVLNYIRELKKEQTNGK